MTHIDDQMSFSSHSNMFSRNLSVPEFLTENQPQRQIHGKLPEDINHKKEIYSHMLQELYEQYKDSFSKSDHKLIQYLLRNEEQLQYITSEELSSHTGISPATVSRFWKKIGFQNLKELKIKQRIQDTASPSTRLTSALKRFEETASLTEDLKMHFGNNTEKTLDRMDPALPTRAAALLLQAQHVYIFAPDASCGLASIFCYRARRLGIQPVLLEGGSAIYEYMINITDNDLVLIFSFSRLLRETRILLDLCQKINCPVILFTDLFSTQEGSPSRLTFYCYRGEPNEYHSMTVPLLILDLIILHLMQASKNSLSSSHYLEELRAEYAQIVGR